MKSSTQRRDCTPLCKKQALHKRNYSRSHVGYRNSDVGRRTRQISMYAAQLNNSVTPADVKRHGTLPGHAECTWIQVENSSLQCGVQ